MIFGDDRIAQFFSSRRIRAMLSKSEFFSNVLKLGGGTALGQAIVIAATPLLTRLYSPAEIGLLGLFMAFVGVATVGIGLRYEMAIVSALDEREADCLMYLSLLIILPGSLLAGLSMLVMVDYNLLSYGMLPWWSAAAIVLTLLVTGIFTVLRFWFVKRADFSMVSRALIEQGAGRATVSIAMGWAQAGWIGLLLGEITGRMLGVVRMMRHAWPSLRESIRISDSSYSVQALKRNWKFPAIVMPSSMVDMLAAMLPLPIISSLFGVAAAGQFLLVDRLINLPAGFVSGSVADVFHSTLSNTFQLDPTQVRLVLSNVVKKLGLTSLIIYIPVALASPFIFGTIFGKEWMSTGMLMTILSPVGLVGLVVSPVSRLLLVVNRSELKLFVDIFRIIISIVSIYGMNYLRYSFLYCMAAFSILHLMSYSLYFFLIWYASKPSPTLA